MQGWEGLAEASISPLGRGGGASESCMRWWVHLPNHTYNRARSQALILSLGNGFKHPNTLLAPY